MNEAPQHLKDYSDLNLTMIDDYKFIDIILENDYDALEQGVLLEFVEEETIENIGEFIVMLEMLGLSQHLKLLKNTILVSNKLKIFS
jgi:hypothetical protein